MPEEPDSDPVPEILELDHLFEGLAHPHRRYLLYTLLVDAELTLDEIAEKVARWESDADHQPTDDEVEAVYVSLYHNHVPKLVEKDVIAFTETTERVSKGPNAEQVLTVLEGAGGTADSRLEAHARDPNDE